MTENKSEQENKQENKTTTEYKKPAQEFTNMRSCSKFLNDGRARLIIAKKQDRTQIRVTKDEHGEVTKEENLIHTQISIGQMVFPKAGQKVFLPFIDGDDWRDARECLDRLEQGEYDRIDGKPVETQEKLKPTEETKEANTEVEVGESKEPEQPEEKPDATGQTTEEEKN